MDKHKDNGILLATNNLVKFVAGVMDLSKPDNELLNNVYREISEATGIDTALELYRLFKGQQVTFPVRFLNPACVKQRIVEEYPSKSRNMGTMALCLFISVFASNLPI